MLQPSRNPTRERRIEDEIIVDAYNEDERALGWYCYLEDKLKFPFRARCTSERKVLSLKKGEVVEVTGMAPEDDCMRTMLVLIRFAGRTLAAPLAHLSPVGCRATMREAIADWHYWVERGYEF